MASPSATTRGLRRDLSYAHVQSEKLRLRLGDESPFGFNGRQGMNLLLF